MSTVTDYLDSKHMQYSISGNEILLKCPGCGKDKLSINIDSQKYQCWHCQALNPTSIYAKGHLSSLKEHWGDVIPIAPILKPKGVKDPDFTELVGKYHYDLFQNKKAVKYLIKQRGLTEKSIRQFKLGYVNKYNQDWIAIPSFEGGIPKLIKYRKLGEDTNPKLDKYIREKDSKSIMFNADCIEKYDEIIIVEGEFKAIMLIQNGYENVVGPTGGCGTFLPEWYDQLYMRDSFYVLMDSDDAGQKAARDIWSTRLGLGRCKNVVLPKGEDADSCILKYGIDVFKDCMAKADKFRIHGVVSLEEALIEMYRKSIETEGSVLRYDTPWPSLNKHIRGLEKTLLYTVGGIAASGKTSMSIQLAHFLAKNYNMPSLIMCMEMAYDKLATKVVQLEEDLTYKEIDYSDGLIYAQRFGNLPIYFSYTSKVTADMFYNTVEVARNRYGVEFVVFDNLQRMVRTGEESDMAKASGRFKEIAMDFNVIMMLIAQPRKMNGKGKPTYDDLKGSSSLGQDADTVLLIHRERRYDNEEFIFSPMATILIDKDRFSAGGQVKLFFEGDKSRFIEYDSKKV